MDRSLLNRWIMTGSIASALLYAPLAAAQVIPDTTLLVGERSQVTGNANVQIDGGARRGGNLFHSFSQFSVPTGGSAYFNNAADVQNIFSRVTGGSASNIDGVIRANGTANLFLLNPNGILFGPNARLNIGGSFVATTADSIHFADNFQYSATNPQTSPLLTVSAPIGLQMGTNPKPIAVQGNGYNLSVAVPIFTPLIRGSNTSELRVPAGQTLALIGGDIEIDGGTLAAEQGRIELGSVRDGQVSFSPTLAGLAFDYQGNQRLGDIRLSQRALADASGGGMVQVQGKQVVLADGSIILIQNRGTQQGGSISIRGAEAVEMSGASLNGTIPGGLRSETVESRSGADIVISTNHLVVERASIVGTTSFGSGRAGNITVNASGVVQVNGFSSIFPSLASNIGSGAFSSGAGGVVTVSAAQVSILNGGLVSSSNFSAGQEGGIVTVNATQSVEIAGFVPQLFTPSSVAAISTSSSPGNAGKVTINTSRLMLRNGGTVTTGTSGAGNGGTIILNVGEVVEISGRASGSSIPTRVRSSAIITTENIRRAFRLPSVPSGSSGDIIINTRQLRVTDGAQIDVSNQGLGEAGSLRVNADSISIASGGAITAATASGEGGNIDLNVRDVLLLRNNSPITASAGGTGNGGNIRINAGLIVAVPNEDSDIRANSVNARGGNITINASGVFGIQFRPQDTTLSDITATGANSALNGTVQLNIERFDPTIGLLQLPASVSDSSRLIAQGCPANQGNSFVITGRGGLPPTPQQQLDDDPKWSDRRQLVVAVREGRGDKREHRNTETWGHGEVTSSSPLRNPPPLIEATGWQRTPTGELILVANTANPTVQSQLSYPIGCGGREDKR